METLIFKNKTHLKNKMFDISLVQIIFGHVEAEKPRALRKIYSWVQRRKEILAKLGKELDLPRVDSQDGRRERREEGRRKGLTVRASRCRQALCLLISFSNKSV